jgi:hypothetical protein
VDIAAIQKLGAFPMDLPNVGEDPLDKWGIKMPTTKPNEVQPKQAPSPPQTVVADKSIVGTWKTVFAFQASRITQVIEFTASGGYSAVNVIAGPRGTETTSDSGTYALEKNLLTLKSRATGVTLVRKFESKGEDFQVEVQEVGQTVLFKKVK